MELQSLQTIVEELIANGYSLDFSSWEIALQAIVPRNPRAFAQDFIIDEVFCCFETFDPKEDIIYVFAVSSPKYAIKGILINAINTQESNYINIPWKKLFWRFRQLIGL